MGSKHTNTTQQLKELINFSVDELEVNKPNLESLWLSKGEADNIAMLLTNPTETLKFSPYDLIDALKQFIRSANVFNVHNLYIESFIETIKSIEELSPPNGPEKYQEAMDSLILALSHNGDDEKAYCLFQFLYFIRHIFHPKTTDDCYKCALVIGPIFQEAFGKKDNAVLIPAFYQAFAHIIANTKYDQTYYMTSPPIHSQLHNPLSSKALFEEQLENQDKESSSNTFINSQQGAHIMSEENGQPTPETKPSTNKVTELKSSTETKQVDNKPANVEKTQGKKGFKIEKEQIDKAKDITVKTAKWLWHHGKILACYAWKAAKFTWQHIKKAYHAFVKSEFYANTKAKMFKRKKNSDESSKEPK